MSRLEDEIGALPELPTHDLRIAWRRLYRNEPPRRLDRDLLIRALDKELAALSTLSAPELRMKWHALCCGEPMAPASRDLLIREIAYKMQERAHGGLAPAVKRRLRALAEEFEADAAISLVSAPLPKPGTRLLREWGGKTYTVIVLDDGFEY